MGRSVTGEHGSHGSSSPLDEVQRTEPQIGLNLRGRKCTKKKTGPLVGCRGTTSLLERLVWEKEVILPEPACPSWTSCASG